MSRIRKKARPPLVNGRFITERQAAALKAAARADAAGQPQRARQVRIRLEADLADGAQAEWLSGALAETTALEAARGVRVEQSAGRVRLLGRDGMESLRRTGGLSGRQHAAGLAYRRLCEAATSRQGSTLAIRTGGTRQANMPEAVALRIAGARRELDRLEQAVVARYASEGRPALAADAIMVLREVAGSGHGVRSLAQSGARRAALTARLSEALDVLAVALADRTAKLRLHGR